MNPTGCNGTGKSGTFLSPSWPESGGLSVTSMRERRRSLRATMLEIESGEFVPASRKQSLLSTFQPTFYSKPPAITSAIFGGKFGQKPTTSLPFRLDLQSGGFY